MKKEQNIEEQIHDKALQTLMEAFTLDLNEEEDRKKFNQIMQKAKLGMQFKKEYNVTLRMTRGQQLRVIQNITNDPKEFKKYVEISLPELNPIKK
jgi:preprotein translocase subunit SecY